MVTKDWPKRINIHVLSICILDTWFTCSDILGSNYEI